MRHVPWHKIAVCLLSWNKWIFLVHLVSVHSTSKHHSFLSSGKGWVKERKTTALLLSTSSLLLLKSSYSILPYNTSLCIVCMPSVCTGSVHRKYPAEMPFLLWGAGVARQAAKRNSVPWRIFPCMPALNCKIQSIPTLNSFQLASCSRYIVINGV